MSVHTLPECCIHMTTMLHVHIKPQQARMPQAQVTCNHSCSAPGTPQLALRPAILNTATCHSEHNGHCSCEHGHNNMSMRSARDRA
jgi:hypothetical protein